MLVHGALPHVHHFHESPDGVAIFAEHDHHSNEHDHHSHSDDKKSESQDLNSLFSFLIDSHSHLFHIHEFVQFTKRDSQFSKDNVIPFVANVQVLNSFPDTVSRGISRYLHSKKSWLDNPFLLSCSVRAPPHVG